MQSKPKTCEKCRRAVSTVREIILISCNTGAKTRTLACRRCIESMDRNPDLDFDEPDFTPSGSENDRLMDIIRECIDNYSPDKEQEEI